MDEELQWKLITPDNLPKIGDELWGAYPRSSEPVMARAKYQDIWSVDDFAWHGYTHFRPINPPKAQEPSCGPRQTGGIERNRLGAPFGAD